MPRKKIQPKSKLTTLQSVLLVDDDYETRSALVALFELKGFEVFSASNAKDALTESLVNSVSVIVTDIRMPKDSGIDLLIKVKKYRPHVPVIVMTGSPELANSEAVKKFAISVFIKPFKPQALLDSVLQTLQKSQRKAA